MNRKQRDQKTVIELQRSLQRRDALLRRWLEHTQWRADFDGQLIKDTQRELSAK